ncbi:MAG: RNA methyltransferase [Rickettsiella sp.]|nr:RNA methyltransferase [Rickettsiella sp.]
MALVGIFSQIRIVLVNPSDPGNIGATARAMKTMGLKHLYLVAPQVFPHPKASVRASNALDIVAEAEVVDNLEEALQDCHLVFGTSTRERELNWISLTARAAAKKIGEAREQKIAILFGRERCGLSNQELQRCHFQITIPTNPDYSSLNLASAVQIVCYELRLAFLRKTEIRVPKQLALAKVEQLEYFYSHLNTVLTHIEFLQPFRGQQIMDRLRRLFSRAELDETEVKILRGILSAIQKKIPKKNVNENSYD